MALGHMTLDRDLVSSHKLTSSRMNYTQRGNLWGKLQEAVGGRETVNQGPQGHGSLSVPHASTTSELLPLDMEGRRLSQRPWGGELGCRRATALNKI